MSNDTEDDWKIWRREQRTRLLDERNAMSSATRRALAEQVIANLDKVFSNLPVKTLGIYWPIKREIDLLPWASRTSADRQIALALPIVTTPGGPLQYAIWQPGASMIRGFWNIPEPAQRQLVDPDIVIAPLVGFHGLWRLGYGGGYFDRTLAARTPQPISVGVGFEAAELSGFMPQPHDVPMKLIVTDTRIVRDNH